MFRSLVSIVVFVLTFVFGMFASPSFSCEELPLLTISVGTDRYDVDGALFDTVQGTVSFEVSGHIRTVAGRFSISTIDGEIEIANNHLVFHPSQVEETISVVLPEDQRYGLVNLSEELLDAVANTYGYGTMPHRDLRAYLNAHPNEAIPELN